MVTVRLKVIIIFIFQKFFSKPQKIMNFPKKSHILSLLILTRLAQFSVSKYFQFFIFRFALLGTLRKRGDFVNGNLRW